MQTLIILPPDYCSEGGLAFDFSVSLVSMLIPGLPLSLGTPEANSAFMPALWGLSNLVSASQTILISLPNGPIKLFLLSQSTCCPPEPSVFLQASIQVSLLPRQLSSHPNRRDVHIWQEL